MQRGIAIDLAAPDLGIGDQPVSAVAVLLRDERSVRLPLCPKARPALHGNLHGNR